jgi:lambda repressor-like predicted transcriptional regulator
LGEGHETADSGPDHGSGQGALKQRGRLSNPGQRRLTDTGIDDLVARYEAGSTIEILANTFGIHRTTVMAHLERRGVSRRSPGKLTDEMVAEAGRRYVSGETLAQIAAHLGVAPSTLTRELRLAQICIRSGGRPASG